MDVAIINEFLNTQFGEFHPVPVVESATPAEASVTLPFHERWLRPGNTLSGPAMMTLADTVAYVALIARNNDAISSVTSNLNIHFLRRPAPTDLLGRGRVIKSGRNTAVVSVDLLTEGELVAHATVSYALVRK